MTVVAPFDLAKLFCAIDAERERRSLTWAALARSIGVAAPTIRRLAHADDAEADGVLVLLRWLARMPEDFVTDSTVEGHNLPTGGEGVVRVDMELVAGASASREGAMGQTRTSIQRLVATAQGAAVPVASLVRVSEF